MSSSKQVAIEWAQTDICIYTAAIDPIAKIPEAGSGKTADESSAG
jgi:hypothetical protein